MNIVNPKESINVKNLNLQLPMSILRRIKEINCAI